MNNELITRIISYLEPMQLYTKLIRAYFSREEMDEFDKGYVDFFTDFENFVNSHLQNPNSSLMVLMTHYQELIVEYPDSILYNCLEALSRGYEKKEIYNEGKNSVYKAYVSEKCGVEIAELFGKLSDDDVSEFENDIFKFESSQLASQILYRYKISNG